MSSFGYFKNKIQILGIYTGIYGLASLGSFASETLTYIGPLCNISYAGMRAQNSTNNRARTLSFIGGFPFTVISYYIVEEGSNRCFGVDIPSYNKT